MIDFGAVGFGLSGFGAASSVEEATVSVGVKNPALQPGFLAGGASTNLNNIVIRNLTRFSFTLGRKPPRRGTPPLPPLSLPPKGSLEVDVTTVDLGQLDALRMRNFIEVM